MTCSIRRLTAFMLLPASLTAVADTDTAKLDKMTVSAAKSDRPVTEIAAPVTVIDDEEIARTLTESIRDMVRYIPGVTVPFQGQRFGLAGFQIRGLGGNRVQVSVDGVRIPDGFAIGDFTNASRNFIDTDSLKQVEILRGPASSLFGSSALAGVVALTTKDPADWLADTGGDFTVRTRAGYYTADEGWVASGTLAGRGERLSGSIQWVERSGHELDNQGEVGGTGPTRTQPNPHEYDGRNVLAKLLLDEGSDKKWRLTLEQNETDSETNVLNLVRTQDFTAMFGFPYIVDTTALSGDDSTRRQRFSLDYEAAAPGWADHFSWKVYYQNAVTEQETFERRTTIITGQPSPVERLRRAEFEQDILGTEAIARWRFGTGNFEHDLVGGFEIYETRTEQIRDGFEIDLTDGSTSPTVGPDTFPVRDFPNSTTLEAGLYLEDRIAFGERFRLIPGVRVDYYDLDPQLDSIFIEDNPGFTPASVDETSVTPRLGAIYALTGELDLFAQYARGFRSPPYNDVNVGFTNLQFGYTAIPNPDLEPEESRGWELGLRSRSDWGQFTLTAYRNDYDDFIESFVSLGVNPETGLLVFQSQNLTDVRIQGVEASGTLNLGSLAPALDDWQLRAAAAWSEGDDLSADVPLNSIEPATGVIGLRWLPTNLPVDLELVATAVEGKDDVASPGNFQAPGYLTLDLLAGWEIEPGTQLRLGLFNLTDRKYWAWSSVRGRTADDPGLDRYTQPGFNAGASLTWQF
ncbi:MAG: TonB-dependent hemoglobin/transferrin/lactoferrin family receptor [Gammaproteobacteria bacterium]|jgi:hemoglobin/transferrin/lactoferrin receptor protein|nr:TonB-dependent hemoglobin/transferrin/lactoferrin family receptor [Gammaproteobacteria bacterium]